MDGTYARDIEISTSAILLNCNIRMYIQGNSSFNLYNEFNASEKIEKFTTEIINILFVNNNHFNLLIDKEFENKERINKIHY